MPLASFGTQLEEINDPPQISPEAQVHGSNPPLETGLYGTLET